MTAKTEVIKRRNRKIRQGMIIRVLLWAGIVVLVIALTLFLSSRIGLFGSVGEMLDYIRLQF